MSYSKCNQTPKMFCKWCKDSGEKEVVFASHCIRSASGKISCPKLLSAECVRCGKKGHTAKRCTVSLEVRIKVSAANPSSSATVSIAVPNGGKYACLEESTSEEEEKKVEAPVAEKKAPEKAKPVSKRYKSWADWSDSEDEDN